MVRNVDFFCLMVVALRFLTRGINLLAGALLTHYNSELEAARAHGAALDEQNESALKAAGDACCAAMRSAHARHAVACRERFRREVLANKPFWRFEQKLLAPHSHSIAKPSRENGVPPAVAAAEQQWLFAQVRASFQSAARFAMLLRIARVGRHRRAPTTGAAQRSRNPMSGFSRRSKRQELSPPASQGGSLAITDDQLPPRRRRSRHGTSRTSRRTSNGWRPCTRPFQNSRFGRRPRTRATAQVLVTTHCAHPRRR